MNLINKTFVSITDKIKGDSLKARCARSSVVLGIGAFIAKFLGFGSKVILTRLLIPEAMGLMVMILSLTALFEVLTEVGIKQSVIQHKNGADPEYLNMAWWFQGLRGIGSYLVAFILSPWICQFYFDKPELLSLHSNAEIVTMVRVAFLAYLFGGFASPRIHVLEREFKFGKSVLIKQGSGIIGIIITIILAFTMRNVWAIVIGHVSSTLLVCMFSFIFCPFWPRFAYHRESFQGLYRFARGMVGLPALTYIAFNIDILVAGRLVSASLVGMYGMALVLARAPQDLFSCIISPILLPAFAEKQDHREALCRAVLKITKITALFGFPLVALAIICSKTVLSLVFGEPYSSVAVPFNLLCIYVLLLIEGTVLGNVFFSIGQPGKHRLFVGLRALILIVLIYPAIKLFGLTGAAAIVLLANFTAICLQVTIIRKAIGLNIFDYAVSWVQGLALALPVLAVVVILKGLIPNLPAIHLIVGGLVCIVVWVFGFLLPVFNNWNKQVSHEGLVAKEVESA